MHAVYVICVVSCIIPTFVGLVVYTLIYRDLLVINLKGEISRNICNGSPRYLELNQIEESGN